MSDFDETIYSAKGPSGTVETPPQPAMSKGAAANQEQEITMKTGLATAIFEPLLILAMGGLVLLIVLAVLLPVFELNQLVK